MRLVLIKAGFINKSVAALYAMNWQLLNNRPILWKKEDFVLFTRYSVYYAVCEEGKGGLTPTRGN